MLKIAIDPNPVLQTYKLTASQLVSLLRVLGALVADYVTNPKEGAAEDLRPFLKLGLEWSDLPHLSKAVNTALKGGDKTSALFELSQDLRDAQPAFRNNAEYTTPELKMLNALRSYLATDSESALEFIKKHASVFGTNELAKIFSPDIPEADHDALKQHVKSLVGREGSHLTIDESKLLKETNPKAYEKYAELRKAHNTQFKALLSKFVRDSGKDKLPYPQVYKAMVEEGLTHSMVPGFTGLVDDQGRWFTKRGELINGVPNLTTYERVEMNDGSDPDAKWEFKAIKPDGQVAYAYTMAFRKSQAKHKFENVAAFMKKLPSIRKNWLVHVHKFDHDSKLSVAAVVLEILYSFAARVGSEPGRGVGTLLVKNSSETQQGINLAYLGKDSIPTKHIIKRSTSNDANAVVDALHILREGKTPSNFLFTTASGLKVTPSDVNKAFHTFGAPPAVTVHKLRTARGTNLFRQLVERDDKRPPPRTEKEAMSRWKDMTMQVGKLLNHKRGVGTDNESVTGTTAATSYISGDIQLDLWASWGFRPPVQLEKLFLHAD